MSIEKKEIKEKFTQPPKYFTEDTLLKSMENTGNDALESDIAQGKSSKEEFLKDIENEIKEVVLTYSK